jgi:hypothetical protein
MGKLLTTQRCLWLILLLILLSIKPVMGQYTKMVVHKTDGTTMVFDIPDIKELTFSGVTGIGEMEKAVNAARLLELIKTYPNPASKGTTIEYRIEEPGPVKVSIYSQEGVLVKELINKTLPAGEHSTKWNAEGESGARVTDGIYICTIQFKNQLHSKRIIIINKETP